MSRIFFRSLRIAYTNVPMLVDSVRAMNVKREKSHGPIIAALCLLMRTLPIYWEFTWQNQKKIKIKSDSKIKRQVNLDCHVRGLWGLLRTFATFLAGPFISHYRLPLRTRTWYIKNNLSYLSLNILCSISILSGINNVELLAARNKGEISVFCREKNYAWKIISQHNKRLRGFYLYRVNQSSCHSNSSFCP